MTPAEFDHQFARLAAHFHLPADDTRNTIAKDWMRSLQHFHVDAFDHAISELIKTEQDRFWPALGRVMSLIKSRIDKYERTDGKCQTCHGSTWIESAPFKSNGMIYAGVCMRCPDCGIPAPQYTEPSNRHQLTSREHAEWRMGDAPRDYMPTGLEAKERPEGEVNEMKAAMERLRIKLFNREHAKGELA